MRIPAGSSATPASPLAAPTPAAAVTVAIQGERGSFSDVAARRLLGEPELACFDDFEAAAASVGAGESRYAALPVENSIAGRVLDLPSLLDTHGLEVVAELVVPVRQALIAARNVELGELREVRSHPVALAQCGRFLASHRLRAVAVRDTVGAVREVCAAGRHDRAAIGPVAAAVLHGGHVLVEDVADAPDNRTRFALVQRRRDDSRRPPAVRAAPGTTPKETER